MSFMLLIISLAYFFSFPRVLLTAPRHRTDTWAIANISAFATLP